MASYSKRRTICATTTQILKVFFFQNFNTIVRIEYHVKFLKLSRKMTFPVIETCGDWEYTEVNHLMDKVRRMRDVCLLSSLAVVVRLKSGNTAAA